MASGRTRRHVSTNAGESSHSQTCRSRRPRKARLIQEHRVRAGDEGLTGVVAAGEVPSDGIAHENGLQPTMTVDGRPIVLIRIGRGREDFNRPLGPEPSARQAELVVVTPQASLNPFCRR
jgi:hypothetical protein